VRPTHVHFEHSSVCQILNCQVQGRGVCSARAPPMSVPIYRRLGMRRSGTADVGTATPRKVDLGAHWRHHQRSGVLFFGGEKN